MYLRLCQHSAPLYYQCIPVRHLFLIIIIMMDHGSCRLRRAGDELYRHSRRAASEDRSEFGMHWPDHFSPIQIRSGRISKPKFLWVCRVDRVSLCSKNDQRFSRDGAADCLATAPSSRITSQRRRRIRVLGRLLHHNKPGKGQVCTVYP